MIRTSVAGSLQRGYGAWPALGMVLIVLMAALYAFAPRPNPPFAPTQIRPEGLHVNGLAQSGKRIVAVGEQGRILVADDPKGPWREATVNPQRGSNLNNVAFVGNKRVLAVGHDSWILRSEDGGETWTEVALDMEKSEPLLGIAGPFDGRLFAFGAFGQLQVSSDEGRSWQRETLVDADAGKPALPKPAPEAADDPFADPFSNFQVQSSGIAERHFNAMTQAADGSLILVGERGLIARSTDGGRTWKAGEPVYAGSFFGVLSLPSKALVVYGMRGNAFHSEDFGVTWTRSEVPEKASLFGGTVTQEGNVVLVGAGNAVFVSHDGGASFRRVTDTGPAAIAAALPLAGGELLTAGETGVALRTVKQGAKS